MKHAECVLACVCVRERERDRERKEEEGEGRRAKVNACLCVSVCACTDLRGVGGVDVTHYSFFGHEMTNIVTLDIFGLGYAGQIWWPTMEVELTKKSPQDTAGVALHTRNCDWRWKRRTKLSWWNRWCKLSFSKQRPTFFSYLSFVCIVLWLLWHKSPQKSPSHPLLPVLYSYMSCFLRIYLGDAKQSSYARDVSVQSTCHVASLCGIPLILFCQPLTGPLFSCFLC